MIASWRRRVIGLTLVIALLLGVGAGGAFAQPATESAERPRKPTLEPRLDRFPLGTKGVATTGAQSGTSDATIVTEPGGSNSGIDMWILLAGAEAIVILLATGATIFQWQRERRSETLSLSTSALAPSTQALFQQALAESIERSPRVVELPKGLKSRQQSEQEQQPHATDTGTPDPAAVDERDYEGFGKKITGILEAAEAAAAQIRAEAKEAAAQTRAEGVDAAADIRKAAEDEAQVCLARAEQEAGAVRSAAETRAQNMLQAAEADSAARIQAAEAQVQNMLADAESQVVAIHEDAAEKARQIQQAAREREDVLRAQVAPLEENLRRALEAFRGISGQLEELLADLPGSSFDDSLVDTLNESAKAEARSEQVASR